MKKNWSHRHPAVMAWTPEMEKEARPARRKRHDIADRIETFIGLALLLWSFPVTVWLAENNAPAYVSLPAFGSMWLASLALLMEPSRHDDLP
jgi:hypothetical protein